MRAPPSRPHLSLITAKGAHLQIPWHWEVTASISESVGDYSSVHSNQYALSRHCINRKDHICGQDNNVDVFTICSPTQTTKGACATLAPAPPKISFASFPWVPIASQTFQETRGKEFLLGPLFIVVTLGAPPPRNCCQRQESLSPPLAAPLPRADTLCLLLTHIIWHRHFALNDTTICTDLTAPKLFGGDSLECHQVGEWQAGVFKLMWLQQQSWPHVHTIYIKWSMLRCLTHFKHSTNAHYYSYDKDILCIHRIMLLNNI